MVRLTLLEKANNFLESSKIHLRIEDRGGWLSLRGVFPSKPGRGDIPHQQRVTLGLCATPQGIVDARDKALEIRGLLNQGKFDWSPYLKVEKNTGEINCEALIHNFKEQYLGEGGSVETWNNEFLSQYKKISDLSKPLDLGELREILLGIEPTKRVRKRAALAFSRLAESAGIEHELRRLTGTYSSNDPINPRDLPSDELIASWWSKIPNAEWRNAYALQAIYGLRNYEIFKLNFDEFPVIFVNKGKTKLERYAFPLYPEWVDLWLSGEIILPNCNGSNSALGNRVTHQFARYSIPFDPYDLRHVWGRRAFDCRLPIETAARSLGHRVDVHQIVYQHWITMQTFKDNYDRVMSHPDRPRPPQLEQ